MPVDSTTRDQLRRLDALTGSALGRQELKPLLDTMLERVRELFGVDTATVLRHDEAAGRLIAIASAGIEEEVFQDVRVPVGAGFAGRVARERQPVLIDHVDSSTVVNPLLWEHGLTVLLGVPMLVHDELEGVLHIGSTTARTFDAEEIELLRMVADRLALAIRAETASADRSAAAALQRSLLPVRIPSVTGMDFASRYVPGAEKAVGGDWYDVFSLPGNQVGIVMGDVAGHGLAAAVVMGRLRSALRAYALDTTSPAESLGKLSRKVNHFEQGIMATVAYGIVAPDRETVLLSLAGHPPPVLAAPGAPARLVDVGPDLPVGLGLPPSDRHDTEVALPPGASLAFYTDGLIERRDAPLDDGFAKLTAAMTTGDPDTVCARVMSALVGTAPARDDVALLIAARPLDAT
ncbi:GAF domain-containing SpoIIE family protein phosphatase [Amycolatopsis rhabdoformis]|uniref:GAF domain-containing SpoIIE family protein phosphatase n=1 Tax=Amycolatopsis rhabdoformis TaxID=1448059 RepID=A0ABZ1IJQ7_9PSEU|nr:GAF domain-containing SpoIIE family protein phosphatase [Amycolatopsis rhabdoformis]WSE34651.1 GAF domain-containing SpoIIE family protein phosphatase [Amycolatopsis rhabdoformis]